LEVEEADMKPLQGFFEKMKHGILDMKFSNTFSSIKSRLLEKDGCNGIWESSLKSFF